VPPPDPFAAVQGSHEELRQDESYQFDNAHRGEPNCLVIQLTLSGEGCWQDERGRQLVPAEHAMLFTHREPTRYGFPPEATQPYRLRYLAVSLGGGIRDIFDRLRHDFGSVVRMDAKGEARALFDEIAQRYHRRSFADRYHESELIYRCFVALYREQVRGTRHTDRIEFGYHYLHNHFRSPISLKEVAARCGVTREHFSRACTVRYGESPARLLQRLRLAHAQAMVQASELPVAAIAAASGFASESSFRRAFRRGLGHAPRQLKSPPR
jgi:AraC-like DNA-binding protein